MKGIILIGLMATASSAVADDGWILYAPPPGQLVGNTAGAEYLQELLRGYEDTFYAVEDAASNDPNALKEQCVQRLRSAAQQIGYALQGFSYDLSLAVEGKYPPLAGVECRISASSDLSVNIETREK